MISDFSEVPTEKAHVVQRYLSNCHLINGRKYDLRLYLLVTSMDPIQMYLYPDGIVRFATHTYSNDTETINDKFMHLTNICLNRQNEDKIDHAWKLEELWEYMEQNELDHKKIWNEIKDISVKTIISAEHSIMKTLHEEMESHYNGFIIFGIDIIIDANMKPWVLELNPVPSLGGGSRTHLMKGPMVAEAYSMARFHIPNNRLSDVASRRVLTKLSMVNTTWLDFNPILYSRSCSNRDKQKQNEIMKDFSRDPKEIYQKILADLTPDDVRCLIRYEDELALMSKFEQIFPSKYSSQYFKYFSCQRYYNLLLHAWEWKYGKDRRRGIEILKNYTKTGFHLQYPKHNLHYCGAEYDIDKCAGNVKHMMVET